jgi:hypothetical protein
MIAKRTDWTFVLAIAVAHHATLVTIVCSSFVGVGIAKIVAQLMHLARWVVTPLI